MSWTSHRPPFCFIHEGRPKAGAELAMTAKHTFATSPRHAPEPLKNLPPKEGVGNAGCPLHPRPRVHLVVVERTRVTTSTPESPDVPARNGFNGFLRALLGDRALLPPSPADMFLSKPGWADSNSANLTPASGRQDHTTSPYAATSLVRSLLIAHRPFANPPCNPVARKTLPRPPHPIPTFVTIMIRPSSRDGMARTCRDDLPDGESEIFLREGLDKLMGDLPVGHNQRPSGNRIERI